MKTGWYIGRFQPFHKGHQAMIEKILEECDTCVVLVRPMEKSEDNPYDMSEVYDSIYDWVDKSKLKDKVVAISPMFGADELTVYYGRKVGWDFKEIKLDKETEAISASKIRNDNLDNG